MKKRKTKYCIIKSCKNTAQAEKWLSENPELNGENVSIKTRKWDGDKQRAYVRQLVRRGVKSNG
jgi:hypothetical protein